MRAVDEQEIMILVGLIALRCDGVLAYDWGCDRLERKRLSTLQHRFCHRCSIDRVVEVVVGIVQ